MRIPERVGCSRFLQGSVALSSFARAGGVAHRATATGGATKLAITIWIFAVAGRLILINQPYIDHWSRRQCDAAAIARNLLGNRFRFAYQQIYVAGNATGYTGTEFPI